MPLLLMIGFSMFSIGSYLVWPSRWNIPAHVNLGFAFTAYFIPILLTDTLKGYSVSLEYSLTMLTAVGAGFFLIGMIGGAALPRFRVFRIAFAFTTLSEDELIAFTSRRAIWLGLFSIVGMAISFRVMGFVPMFVSDPLVAKYLRGSYQDSYRQVAVLFRGSEQIIQVTLPIIIVLLYVTRRWIFILIALLQGVVITLTLNRGLFGLPLLAGIGLIAASRGLRPVVWYIVLSSFGVAAASASTYYAAKFLLPQTVINDTTTVWDNIADGAPDVPSDLELLDAFDQQKPWTYGLTFVGGLIPFQCRWSPGVWSLYVLNRDNHADINDVVSGGLRVPPQMMGYTAFGWSGVIIVCLLSGIATGYGANFGRAFIGPGSLVSSVIALTVYNTVIYQAVQCYTITIYNVFSIFVALIFMYRIGFGSEDAPSAPASE